MPMTITFCGLERLWRQVKSLNVTNMFTEGEISMKPKAIWSRSVKVGNLATVLVMLIVYPILLAYRGLDYPLLAGMLLHYFLFWCVVVFLFLFLHASWIIGFFVTQRICTNMLDFEILDQIFGRDNGGDMSDWEDGDNEIRNLEITQRRATG